MSLSCVHTEDASLKSNQSIYYKQSLACANLSCELLLYKFDVCILLRKICLISSYSNMSTLVQAFCEVSK